MSPLEPPAPRTLTVTEVAALLRVNHKTVREAIARGELPGAVRVGRVIRLSRSAVLDWLAGTGRASLNPGKPR